MYNVNSNSLVVMLTSKKPLHISVMSGTLQWPMLHLVQPPGERTGGHSAPPLSLYHSSYDGQCTNFISLSLPVIITSGQSNLAKGRIADLSPSRLPMDSSDLDPHLTHGFLDQQELAS